MEQWGRVALLESGAGAGRAEGQAGQGAGQR